MDDTCSAWRNIIDRNFVELCTSTIMTSQMNSLLLQRNLITRSQKDSLILTPDYKQPSTIYSTIAKQWTDVDFWKFKSILKETRNTRALEILTETQDLSPPKEVSGLAACSNYWDTVSNLLKENKHEEEESEYFLSNNETRTKHFRAEFKPEIIAETSGLNEVKPNQSVTDQDKLKQLERKFEELETSMKEELRLKTEEANEFRTLLSKLESETALRLSSLEESLKQAAAERDIRINQTWTMEHKKDFDLKKVMGNWFAIEKYWPEDRPPPDCHFWKFLFFETENIINCTQSQLDTNSSVKTIHNFEVTPLPQTPYIWKFVGLSFNRVWIQTDYDNYAIFATASDTSIASFTNIYILSRKQTLSPQTLEMLRNVAANLGFSKTNGILLGQPSP